MAKFVWMKTINKKSSFALCVDENLSDIILMNRNELEQFRKKYEEEKSKLDKYVI